VDHEIRSILGRVSGGVDLSMDEMTRAVDSMIAGAWTDEEIALFLNALRQKGETVDEIAGAAAALRRRMTPLHTSRTRLIDTCGTGGDASGTFNISTAAALVTAAAGVPVAKHGNRAITSRSGSAEVLTELGVNILAPVPVIEACLDRLGICFCFAPQFHPSMKRVAAARKMLGVPTIFNLIGPLCNPASAPYQLLGVGRDELRELLSAALRLLGTQRAIIVCGVGGLDEVSLSGTTMVTEIRGHQLHEFGWEPADFGLAVCSTD
jgi:anthranilate phosphoribosyltransferase